MDLQEFSEKLELLSPHKKIKFVYENINKLSEEGKISILCSIIEHKDSSPIVRATALKFLGTTSFQELAVLHECLKDRHQAVSKAAKKALENLETLDKKNKNVSQSIQKKIESVKDKNKRLQMIKALSKSKDAWIPQALLGALKDPSEEIREYIVNECGNRENLNLNLVYQKLLSPLWYVKSSALKVLAIKKKSESVKHIRPVINDRNADVKRSAALALGEIGGKDSLVLLARLAKDENPYVRSVAEKALGKASSLRFT
jgi:HEAT repeat protein